MFSISRFTLGLSLVIVGMFTVGVGAAYGQTGRVGLSKSDHCIIVSREAGTSNLMIINLETVVRIADDGNGFIRFYAAGASSNFGTIKTVNPAADMVLYTAKMKACMDQG